MKTHFWLLFTVLLTLAFIACQKNDDTSLAHALTRESSEAAYRSGDRDDDFFDLHAISTQRLGGSVQEIPNEVYVLELNQLLAEMDNQRPLVDDVIEYGGYPLWDRALAFHNEEDERTQVILPLIDANEDAIRTVLYAKKNVAGWWLKFWKRDYLYYHTPLNNQAAHIASSVAITLANLNTSILDVNDPLSDLTTSMLDTGCPPSECPTYDNQTYDVTGYCCAGGLWWEWVCTCGYCYPYALPTGETCDSGGGGSEEDDDNSNEEPNETTSDIGTNLGPFDPPIAEGPPPGGGSGGGNDVTDPPPGDDLTENLLNDLIYQQALPCLGSPPDQQFYTLNQLYIIGSLFNDVTTVSSIIGECETWAACFDWMGVNDIPATTIGTMSVEDIFHFQCVTERLGLEPGDDNWDCLLSNPGLTSEIRSFLDEYPESEEAEEFSNASIGLIKEDGQIKFQRMREIFGTMPTNPLFLLEDCLDQDPNNSYANWQDLALFTPPPAVINRLNNMDGDWEVQHIEEAAGFFVNMDKFGVTVSQLPDMDGDGTPESPDDFLQHIRTNINSFVNTFWGEFAPLPGDESLWLSEDPLTSIIEIDIPSNDGSVITSQSKDCCWIFTTINTPWARDHIHPVSGNRQFAYEENIDGSFTFYTKGVDRVTKWWHAVSASDPFMFAGADQLWNSFQNKVGAFVNNHNGTASKNSDIKVRPPWSRLKEKLKGSEPITEIPCD